MATMNISLPDPMRDWIESQVAEGRHANISDYMRDLVRKAQERQQGIVELQKLIDEGLASGISKRTPDEVFENAKNRALEAMRRNGHQDDIAS